MDKQTYEEKLERAKEYLRSRGKYVLDEGCKFVPTPYTTPVPIAEKYGKVKGASDA